tara:strand:+ start:265 stop:768 length:504 start_codon:yes stop_codon:yes gene_type:complete
MIKKLALKALLSAFIMLGAALFFLRIMGYEPKDTSPGLWINGNIVSEPVTDWSFTNEIDEIFVETRTSYLVPHSVTTYCGVYEGRFYLFSAYYNGGEFPYARRWNQNVIRDPRVKLKIGGDIYQQNLSFIGDESIKAPIHNAFVNKYSNWQSPGIENVHIFLVEPRL